MTKLGEKKEDEKGYVKLHAPYEDEKVSGAIAKVNQFRLSLVGAMKNAGFRYSMGKARKARAARKMGKAGKKIGKARKKTSVRKVSRKVGKSVRKVPGKVGKSGKASGTKSRKSVKKVRK